MSPSSAGLPFCAFAARCRSRPGASEVPDTWRPAVWPASRSARPRSTGRFAGGRAFPGCGPSRARSGRRQPTSAWVSSGCLCRPGWRRSAFPADGVPGAVRVPRALTRVAGRLHRPFRGRSLRKACSTSHRPCRCPCRTLASRRGQAGIQGFQLRSMVRTTGRPSTDLRPGRLRGQRLSSRRRSSRTRREDNSPGFLLPSRV